MRRLKVPRIRSSQRGLTLIEVMVVVLIFSFGMLGLVGLQARAFQFSVNAEDSNRAALLASELASAMWNNNSTTLAAGVITTWQARLADATGRGLPNGQGAVVVNGNVASITVQWLPPGQDAAAPHRYVTEVLIPVPVP